MNRFLSPTEVNGPPPEITIQKVSGETLRLEQDSVALEEPLEIQLVYGAIDTRVTKSITVTMRTPGHDSELAAGFLLTEGVIRDAADIVDIFNPLEEGRAGQEEA